MKKSILPVLILIFLFPAIAVSDTVYLILLRNGGRITTPWHWVEGTQRYFHYLGGTVGIEEKLVDRIEKYEIKTTYYPETASENGGKQETPPSPAQMNTSPGTGKAQEIEKTAATKEGGAKLNIEAYKNKKDQMQTGLEELLEKRREATRKGDNEAKKLLTEEISQLSGQIYQLTDEVTALNKGKLPEGWWEK